MQQLTAGCNVVAKGTDLWVGPGWGERRVDEERRKTGR